MSEYILFACRKCGHEVLALSRPYPIQWSDGHICKDWVTKKEEEPPILERKDENGADQVR